MWIITNSVDWDLESWPIWTASAASLPSLSQEEIGRRGNIGTTLSQHFGVGKGGERVEMLPMKRICICIRKLASFLPTPSRRPPPSLYCIISIEFGSFWTSVSTRLNPKTRKQTKSISIKSTSGINKTTRWINPGAVLTTPTTPLGPVRVCGVA